MSIFTRNKGSKKYEKNFAKNTYEVVNLDLEDTVCVLSSIESGVVGTSTVFQKASRMIIMVDRKNSDIEECITNITSMGLMYWDYDNMDVVFIAGSLSDFYLLCAYYVSIYSDNTFISFIINALKAVHAKARVFSDDQMSVFRNSTDIISTDILPDSDSARLDSIINEINECDIKKYTLDSFILADADPIRRKYIMSLCDFSFVGEKYVVAYMSKYKSSMLSMVNKECYNNEEEHDDMIATEVID